MGIVKIEKNFRFLTIGFIFILPIVCSSYLHAKAKQQLTLSVGEWLPYTGENLPQSGYAAQIVKEAFGIVDIDVKFQFYPWKRAYVNAKQGVVNGSILWMRKPEREQHFIFSEPVIEADIVFFYHKDKPISWSQIQDLEDIKIGIVRGFEYEQEFAEAIAKGLVEAESVATQRQNLRMLLAGRIDTTPIVKGSGYATIDEFFSDSDSDSEYFTHHPNPLTTQKFHLILNGSNSDNLELIKAFNQGLSELKNNGRYQEIISQISNH